MTTTDTDLKQLVINKLTQQQYDGIQTPSDNELYFVTDGTISSDDVDDTNATNKFVTASDITTWNGKSDVSGTNDGTNWTAITINGTTKSIPSGGGGGSATDVQINGTSIVVSDVANIITESAYNATTNKIATMSDISGKQDVLTFSTGLTNTSGTITVTDYNIILKNNSSTVGSTVSLAVGYNSNATSGIYGRTAIGCEAIADGAYALALGYGTTASALSAIQLGVGSNTTAETLKVGFYNSGNFDNYQLLDGTTGLIPDARISSNIARVAQSVTALSGTSITLTDNSVNTLTPSGNTTFTLPTVTDTTKFHQILVQLNLSTVYTIDLGTTTYFDGAAPDLSSTGNYNIIYEYDNSMSVWVVGSVKKG